MTTAMRVSMLASVALFGLGLAAPAQAQSSTMSFFVTSAGSGKGGDPGGPHHRWRRGYDLQELYEQHRGRGYVGPFRPHRAQRQSAIEILERVASFARAGRRLLSGRSQEHRRCRALLLLRYELTG